MHNLKQNYILICTKKLTINCQTIECLTFNVEWVMNRFYVTALSQVTVENYWFECIVRAVMCVHMCCQYHDGSCLLYIQDCSCVDLTHSVSCSSGHFTVHHLYNPMRVHLQLCDQWQVGKDKWNGRIYIWYF